MEDIINEFFGAIGDFLSTPIVQLALQVAAIYWVGLWIASAFWVFRDLQRRTENPVLPYLAAAMIVVFTPVLFIFAVLIYRIIRPAETLGEVYERNLAEEALLAEVEVIKHCPTCHRRVNDQWIICPTCRTRLHRVCANCGKLVDLDWSLCAWCGRDFERREPAGGTLEPIPAARERGTAAADTTAGPQGRVSRPRSSAARSGGAGGASYAAETRGPGSEPLPER
jgi:RNA polymerase subunit RPABC4/transcription elongation factor Spt4